MAPEVAEVNYPAFKPPGSNEPADTFQRKGEEWITFVRLSGGSEKKKIMQILLRLVCLS